MSFEFFSKSSKSVSSIQKILKLSVVKISCLLMHKLTRLRNIDIKKIMSEPQCKKIAYPCHRMTEKFNCLALTFR